MGRAITTSAATAATIRRSSPITPPAHLLGEDAVGDEGPGYRVIVQDDINNEAAMWSKESYFERHNLPIIMPSRRTSSRELEEEINNGTTTNSSDNITPDLETIIQTAREGNSADARLRRFLLSNYDKHSYPWEYVWYNDSNNKRTGVPVEMNVNFHRVFDVDIIGSVMDLIVWFRLKWVDPRLAWEPNDFGGLNKTRVWIGDGGTGGETSEIWVPGMFICCVSSCLCFWYVLIYVSHYIII